MDFSSENKQQQFYESSSSSSFSRYKIPLFCGMRIGIIERTFKVEMARIFVDLMGKYHRETFGLV